MRGLARTVSGALCGAFLLLAPAAHRPAGAAESCPALPDAQSTFGAALTSLIEKATGGGSSLAKAGDPVKLLNASQQQQVLGWLRTELSGRRAAIEADRQKSEAEKKVEDLKRRIFTRAQMEGDAAVVGNRIYDQVGGEVLPSARQGKPLGQIVDEEIARGKPGLVTKYAAKYKNAIFAAVEADPAKAGEFAGALSAGDYSTVMDQAAEWGAAGFGTMVGDALGEMGYENSKAVWTKAVKHAGAAKDVLLALRRGDHDGAWEVIKDEWKKEVKTQARAAVKTAINFAFDAGSGAGSIGDFIPHEIVPESMRNVISPDFFGLTPGDIYLSLLDAEQEFIVWGQRYLREHSEVGDGACIRKYESEYERTGDRNYAYQQFLDCIPTSKYSAFPEFQNQAESAGLDYDAMLQGFLEARRTHKTTAWTPLEWIEEKVKAQRENLERQILPELTRTEKVMANIAEGVGPMLDNRLTDFANAVLNDNQWEQLADEISELERALDQTLAAVDSDLDRIRRYSDGISESCADYERQKVIARRALSEGLDLSVTASRLWDRLRGIDTSACQKPEAVSQANDDAAKRAALGRSIDADRAALETEVERVCVLPPEIRDAADKAQARERLDAGLRSAREVEAIAARLAGSADEMAGLPAPDAGASGANGAAASARERVLSEINALKGDIDALAGQFAELSDGLFASARTAMNDAQRRIRNLTDPTEEIIGRIRSCLRPLAAAPVAERPRALLEELSRRSTDIGGCRGVVLESWDERDLDPPSTSGFSSSTPWRNRQLSLSHSVESLRGKLAEIEAQCPAAAETLPTADTGAGPQGSDPQAIKAAAEEGASRMQGCVAEALTTYQDVWGKPKPVAGASCEPAENATALQSLKEAADRGGADDKARLAEFERTASQVQAAHDHYEAAQAAFDAGDTAAARAALNSAKAAVAGLGGNPPCAELAAKIDGGLDKTDRLEQELSSARATIEQCEPGALRELASRIGSSTHPELAEISSQAALMIAAHAKYDEASSAFSSGNLGGAESALHQAQAHLQGSGGACGDLAARIEAGLGKVERLRDAIASAEGAVARCDADDIKRWRSALAEVGNPAARPVKQSLEIAEKRCETAARNEAVAQADRTCMASFGVFALADRSSVDRGDIKCQCKSGYQWSDDGKSCVRAPTAEELAAARNANCRNQYGNGYYAGSADRKGQYYCLPTTQTANAWCRQKNGSGYYAGRVKGDGSFDCYLSDNAARQVALNNCRNTYGSRFIRLVKRNGQYFCEYRNDTATSPPQHDTRASAAAIAAGAAIIEGILGQTNSPSQPSPPSGPRPTYPPPSRGPNDHCKNMSIAAPTCY